MKLLTVQIPDELHEELFMAAARTDRSASLFVREAIREKLSRTPKDQPATSRPHITPEVASESVKRPSLQDKLAEFQNRRRGVEVKEAL